VKYHEAKYERQTTAVAFAASALTPLLATKSFGVFAAILVFYNYFSVIIFFPTVVMVYHLKFENWKWPCFSCPLEPNHFATFETKTWLYYRSCVSGA
jgi:hypothetical protein